MPEQRDERIVETKTEARAGVTGHNVRYVLGFSLIGIIAAFIVIYFLFFWLNTVYSFRYHAVSSGLISYGPDTIDPYRRSAAYVDRILKGEKPADLPVQAPMPLQTLQPCAA